MAEEKDTEAGFLARWSRRKRLGEDQAAAEDPDEATRAAITEAEAEARAAERTAVELEEAANRTAAEEIDLAAMAYGDDFSAFLKRGVPEALKRDALRKFFKSDPLLANLDGLNDYDEDFNNPAHMVYRSSRDAIRGFLDDAGALIEKVSDGLAEATGEGADGAVPSEAIAETAPEAEVPEVPPNEEVANGAEAPLAMEAATVETPAETVADAEPARPPRVSLRRRLEG